MKKVFLKCSFIFAAMFCTLITAEAQVWKDVAPIFYKNCSTCHREGEIGPFPMMSYHDVASSTYLYQIPYQITSGLMPPWKADPNYRHFLDERVLTQEEKDLITNWVDQEAPAGDTTLAPPPPVFPEGSQLGNPDLVLTMSEPHTLAGNGQDEYICFVLPTDLLQDQDISAIEFRPGNGAAVHHVFMYLVKDSSALYKDWETPEYGYPSFGGAGEGVHANFLGLYGPGMVPRFFPADGVFNFTAGSFFLIQIHYAPLTYVTTDQSSVNLFFSASPNPRTVKATRFGEGYITNPPFKITAYEVDTFYSEVEIADDFSLFGIAPHQHLLGKEFKIFAVEPGGDTIPLIHVPHWDFHWQLYYSFPFMIHLVPGTKVYAMGVYDNTTNNPWNPNNPPQDVGYGEGSTDEMFKYLTCTLQYEEGDEEIVIDSNYVLQASSPVDGIISTPQLYSCYPNPATDVTSVTYYLPKAGHSKLVVANLNGEIVFVKHFTPRTGLQREILDVNSFPDGAYFVSLITDGISTTKPFFIQR